MMNTVFSRANARRPETSDSVSVISAVRIYRWLLLLLMLPPEIALAQPLVRPNNVRVNEGEVVSITVVLASVPMSTAIFEFDPFFSPFATAEPASLTFTTTDWHDSQTVKLTFVEDNDDMNDFFWVGGSLTFEGGTKSAYDMLLNVQIIDNDTDKPALRFTPQSLAVDEGGSSIYRVRLSSQPSDTVTVLITGQSGTDLTLDKISLTFTTENWDTDQMVKVSAGQDLDRDEDVVTLRHAASGGGYTVVRGNVLVMVTDKAFPTVEISGVPDRINSTDPFTAAFTFSEAVTGFETGDITINGGTKGAFAGSGTSYTLAVTPDGSADVTVTVNANSATNGDGNTGPASAQTATATWDATRPTMAITGVPAKINSTSAFTATFTFSEAVTGFVTGDVTVIGGTKGALAGSGTIYTLAVTPTSGSNVVVTVAADAATNGLNTGPAAAVSATATWDNTAPTVAITGVPARINSAAPFTATFTFSEVVTGFVTGDVAVTGGTKGAFAGSGISYTLAVTPDGSADVVVTVAADAATDGLNTGPTTAVTATATWDAPPTVEINDVPPRINSTTPFTAEFVFSEAVTGFVTGDIAISGGTKGAFAGSGTTYTLAVTPSGSADVVVLVAADAAIDVDGNTGPTSEVSATATWDAPPTVEINDVPPRINSTTPFTAEFVFSEAVTGFVTGDVAISGGTKGAFAGSGTTYTLAVTPSGSADVVVLVAAEAAIDVDGNTGPTSEVSATATWDAPPTVEINDVPPRINSTTPFTAEFVFSEAVTDFEIGDVTVTGGTKGTFTATNATTYTLDVTPNGSADVVVTVAANSAADGINTGPASAVSATTIWDATPPTVKVSGIPARINSRTPLTAIFMFSEAVTGFEIDDITMSGGNRGTFTAANATTYTLDVTPNGSEDVVVTVAANAATDGLNTGPASAVTEMAIWDPAALTVTINDVPFKINSTNPFSATFTFSEIVTGFMTQDVTITGGTKGTLSGSGRTYTLAVIPNSGSNVAVTVAANSVTNGLNTGPASAVSATAIWDAIPPTVEISGLPPRINTTTVLSVTFTFSETVTGFNDNDITVSGGTKGTFTATNATTYTLDVTPNGSEDVVVTAAANAATDGLNTGPPSVVTETAIWDAAALSVTINDVPLKINAIDPFIAEFVFSEAVMEFVTGDVTVTGGTKGTFAGSGTTYTLVVTPSGFEDVVVTVAANAATDGLKTGPASAVSEMAIWDATAPTLTIGGVPPRINTTTVLSVTFTFSEAVTVFNDNDITVSGGTKGTFTATNATTYTLAVTPDGSVDVVVTVAADAATDGLNTGPPSAVTATAAWGGAAPTVTIEDASATEGDAMTFTVTLDEAVSGGLKVTPGFTDGTATKGLDYTENTAALTFAGTAGETQTFTVATTEDLLVEDDETFTVDLMVSGTTAMVSATDTGTGTIADNEAPGLVVKPDALSLREGASESFTVALSAAPLTDVMVTITGHAGSDLTLDRELLTFTTTNWSDAQTVTVIAAEDDDFTDDQETLTLSVSGGGFAGEMHVLSVTVEDNDVPDLLVAPVELAVTEGASASFTVALSDAPLADVTVTIAGHAGSDLELDVASLTFTTTNWSDAQMVTVTAAEDDDFENDPPVTLMLSAAGGGYDGVSARVVVEIDDNDEAALVVQPLALSVDEGGTADFTAALSAAPPTDVTVTITGHAGSDLTLDRELLTFTTTNWSDAQTVTVIAAEDDDFTDDQETLTLSVSGGGFAGEMHVLSVTVEDNDVPDLLVAPVELAVTEGASASFTVALSDAPLADVTVTIAGHAGSDLELDVASLTFTTTNWSDAQMVTVTAAEDDDFENDPPVTLMLSAAGGGYDGVSARVVVEIDDNDEAALVVQPLALSVDEGGTADFTAALSAAPLTDVTVTITGHAGSDLSLDKSSLMFTTTNWNAAQTVMVTAAEDDDFENDLVTLTLAAFGGGHDGVTRELPVTVTDAGERPLTVSVEDAEAVEGTQMLRMRVVLNRPADQVVGVNYATSDQTAEQSSDYMSARGIMIFDRGATHGVLSVELKDDDLAEGNEVFEVTLTNASEGLTIGRSVGEGVILDDDGVPLLRIDDVAVSEEEEVVRFTLRLSEPSARMVTVRYRTEDGSAQAGMDYVAAAGMVQFKPGRTEAVLEVELMQDGMDWREETFTVHLEAPEHARLEKAVATATVRDETSVAAGVMAAYASRFVRTSAIHVVEALESRMRSGLGGSDCSAGLRREESLLWHPQSSWNPSLGQLLSGCRVAAHAETPRGVFSAWGRASYTQFHGRTDDALTLRGQVSSGLAGADYRWHQGWMAGVLLAHSYGEGTFEVYQEAGDIRAGLTGVYPYLAYHRPAQTYWLTGGFGRGTSEVLTLEGDLTSRFGATGLQGDLWSGRRLRLKYLGDLLFANAKITEHDISVRTHRVRAGMEGSLRVGGTLRPYGEVYVRRDGGSAETGTGLEVGGGVSWAYPAYRLKADVRSRRLVLHTADGFSEWGFSGALVYGGHTSGLTLALRPMWGSAAGGLLYRQPVLQERLAGGLRRTALEAGYGIPWGTRTVRSLLGVTAFAKGAMYRLGSELVTQSAFGVSVSAQVHAPPHMPPALGIHLQSRFQY